MLRTDKGGGISRSNRETALSCATEVAEEHGSGVICTMRRELCNARKQIRVFRSGSPLADPSSPIVLALPRFWPA